MYWTTFRIPYGISHYTRNKDCGTQRALRTLPVGGLQQEHVFLSARHLLSKYTTAWEGGGAGSDAFSLEEVCVQGAV